jgi:hypothetical protein
VARLDIVATGQMALHGQQFKSRARRFGETLVDISAGNAGRPSSYRLAKRLAQRQALRTGKEKVTAATGRIGQYGVFR